MKTIYKYPLEVTDEQEVDMPMGAELLTVQMQIGRPCLWALVDIDKPSVKRKVLMRGSGHPADGLGRYISTFQMKDGALVFHVFEAI